MRGICWSRTPSGGASPTTASSRTTSSAARYPLPGAVSARARSPSASTSPTRAWRRCSRRCPSFRASTSSSTRAIRDKRDSVEAGRRHLPGGPRPDLAGEPAVLQGARPEHPDRSCPRRPPSVAAYDDQLVQTFYLENADATETLDARQGLTGIQKTVANKTLGAITLMGTPDQLARGDTDPRAERQGPRRGVGGGRDPRGQPQPAEALRDRAVELRGGRHALADGSGGEVGRRLHQRARPPAVVAQPGGLRGRAFPRRCSRSFLQTDATVKILASPRLRAGEGKKTSLRIGTEVPIPVTTFTATQAGTSTFAPATSFQYRNVGVNLEMTPKVSASGEITLELNGGVQPARRGPQRRHGQRTRSSCPRS